MELSDNARKVLEILANSDGPIRTERLRRMVGLRSRTSVNRALNRLHENKPRLIQKEGRRVVFSSITPEGKAELMKIEDRMFIRQQSKYFSKLFNLKVEADDFGRYCGAVESPWTVFISVPEIRISLGSSKEVSEEFETVREDYFYGRFPSQTQQLERVIREAASSLVNILIWTRVRKLQHEKRPKALIPENLLDFNLSFTMRFEGKETIRDASLTEYDRLKHRLAAMLLHTIADTRERRRSDFTILDCMIQGKLLEREEGEILKQAYSLVYSKGRAQNQMEENYGEEQLNRMERTFRKAVAKHLVLGGAVECQNTLDDGMKCGNNLDWEIKEEQGLICLKCKKEYSIELEEPRSFFLP